MQKNYEALLEKISYRLPNHLKGGTILLHAEDPLEYIHILTDGTCQIEKYSVQGNSILEMNIAPPQFFGLFEAVHELPYHTVSIRCTSDCSFLKIPVPTFLQSIQEDPELMWMCLRYLAAFTYRTLSQNDQLLMNDVRQNILYKVYRQCQGQPFPVTLTSKKEDLARELNINLRTLYRKLDHLYEEGLLTPLHGKITISEKQYQQISQELFL